MNKLIKHYCEVCNYPFFTLSSYKNHLKGKAHLNKLPKLIEYDPVKCSHKWEYLLLEEDWRQHPVEYICPNNIDAFTKIQIEDIYEA